MRRPIFSLCLACPLLLAASRAAADEAPASDDPVSPAASEPSDVPPAAVATERGVSVGVRTGWSLPIGALEKGDSMRSNFTGMVPIWLDAGYRLSKHLYLGAYFQWGPVFVADEVCPRSLSCSASDLRFGINAHWHFKWIIAGGAWAGRFDPWVGLGAGYEGVTVHLSTPQGARSSETDYGFEYGNFQLGGDYLGGGWRLGLFASLSAAQYTRRSFVEPSPSSVYDIEHPTAHLWLGFGVRFQYDL